MNNPNDKTNSGDYHTDLQCTPFILDCNETANANCLCQTSLTDLYDTTYIDQEKIGGDELRIINIPQIGKQRSLLPVSKFGLTDSSKPQDDNLTEQFLKISTEETITGEIKTEEMNCQTDLTISPHILNKEENSSCQTSINTSPQPKKYPNFDINERDQLYKNVSEILTDIVHDVMAIPQRFLEPAMNPVLVQLSQTNYPAENSEYNILVSEENALHSQVRNNDNEIFDFIVENSYEGDILYYRSDNNTSTDSNVSEVSSMLSLEYTPNSVQDDLPVYAEIVENCDIGISQSHMRLVSMEEIIQIEMLSNDLSID